MFHTSGYSHYPWLTNGGQVNEMTLSCKHGNGGFFQT